MSHNVHEPNHAGDCIFCGKHVGKSYKMASSAQANPTETNQASEDEQIEAVLDRLEAEMNRFTAEHDIPMRDEALSAIEAERNRLGGKPMTKTAKQILQEFERTRKFDENPAPRVDQALKELEAIMLGVIGEDFDIPAEMENVGRDFRQVGAIAKTGGLLNNHKSELRKRLQTALYGKETN